MNQYIVYSNYNHPHTTIHIAGRCGHINKNGGNNQGKNGYAYFDTYEEALNHARKSGLPVNDCKSCNR